MIITIYHDSMLRVVHKIYYIVIKRCAYEEPQTVYLLFCIEFYIKAKGPTLDRVYGQ